MLKKSPIDGIITKPSVVAIGKFDVIHGGHINIIKQLADISIKKNLIPVVIFLNPNPIDFFTKKKSKMLYKITQRYNIIKSFFLQNNVKDAVFIVQKFNQNFVNLTPFEFVESYLKQNLKATHIVCGNNFCFGKNAQGDVNFLQKYINCSIATDFTLKPDVVVSSTLVKKLIMQGRVSEASKYCYQKICYQGIVSRGMGVAGDVLGFKTANVVFDATLTVLPKFGVYKCVVEMQINNNNKQFNAICNIGTKPTFKHNFGDNKVFIEAHIFNFNDDIYGKKMSIYPQNFIREEKKFDSFDDLKNQIKLDIEFCLNII